MGKPQAKVVTGTWSLEGLAKGDKVGYMRYTVGDTIVHQALIDRVTSTQLVLSDGRRFRRADGRQVGNPYGFHLCDPYGEDAVAAKVREQRNELFAELEPMRRANSPRTKEDMLVLLSAVEALTARIRADVGKIVQRV
jgi:hypothetical protein